MSRNGALAGRSLVAAISGRFRQDAQFLSSSRRAPVRLLPPHFAAGTPIQRMGEPRRWQPESPLGSITPAHISNRCHELKETHPGCDNEDEPLLVLASCWPPAISICGWLAGAPSNAYQAAGLSTNDRQTCQAGRSLHTWTRFSGPDDRRPSALRSTNQPRSRLLMIHGGRFDLLDGNARSPARSPSAAAASTPATSPREIERYVKEILPRRRDYSPIRWCAAVAANSTHSYRRSTRLPRSRRPGASASRPQRDRSSELPPSSPGCSRRLLRHDLLAGVEGPRMTHSRALRELSRRPAGRQTLTARPF